MESFKKIGLLLLIICFLLFIASFYFFIVGINNAYNNQTNGIEYIGIAFSGFVAFGTILLALATFYTLFESKRKDEKIEKQLYDQYKERHLDEIRNTCLRSILGEINDKYSNYPSFEIKENQGLDEEFLQHDFDRPRHSYDSEFIFGYNYREIVNNNLYNDLKNHKITIDIPDDFKNILDLIIKNYPIYLKNLIKLIKKVKSLEEFNELENRLKSNPNYNDVNYLERIKEDYCKLIILISLGYLNLKYTFPNLYDMAYNDKEYGNIEKIGDILKNSDEVNLIKTSKYEVKEKVEKLNKKINGILNDNTLMLDECDYLKKIRNII